MENPGQYREVLVKVVVEDDAHCIFGSLILDENTGMFTRHCECRMAER